MRPMEDDVDRQPADNRGHQRTFRPVRSEIITLRFGLGGRP